MGLSDIIIRYIGKTNQISPLLTITSIIKTDRVGSENVYTQALWNQRLWEPYSDILKLLFYYFDTHKNLVIEWGNIAWWGRGGSSFLLFLPVAVRSHCITKLRIFLLKFILIFQVVQNNVLDVTSKWRRVDVILICLTPFEFLIPVIRDKYIVTPWQGNFMIWCPVSV